MNEFINELLSLSRTKLGGPDVGVVRVDSKYSDAYDTAMRKQLAKTLLAKYM